MHRVTSGAALKRLALVALLAATQPATAIAGEPATNRLEALAVRETDAATEIVVSGSDAPTFTVFKLNDPVRLFIDVSNADTAALVDPIDIDNGVVGEVSALQFSDSQSHIGRIIVGLEVDALYKVQARGNELVVTVDASQRKRKAVPVAAAGDSGAGEKLAALEARAALAERRAGEAEARARSLDGQARAADVRAAEVAREALANRARAEAAERERAAVLSKADRAGADRAAAEQARQTAEKEKAALMAAAAEARQSAERERQAREAAEREKQDRLAEATQARAAADEARRQAAAEKARAEEATAGKSAATAAAEEARRQAAAEKARAEEATAGKSAATAAADEARREAAAEKARAEKAAADKSAAEAAAEKARAEKIAAEAAAEKARAEKIAAEAATERALARAAADKAAADKASSEKANAQTAAEKAARRAAELERVAAQSSESSADGQRARAEAAAARQAAEKAAAERIAAEKVASEALVRAQNAEARAQSAEADRQRLQEDLAALDNQRQQSVARISTLEASQGTLARQLEAARHDQDTTAARRLEAEDSARKAEVTSQKAEIARVESAKATSALDTRLKALQAELAAARAGAEERGRLQKSAEDLVQESNRLKEQLRTREAELQAARGEARRLRDAADALPGKVPALTAAPVPAQPAALVAAPQKLRVADVRFDDKAERTEIRVRVQGHAEYELRADGERTRILELKNALIDPSLERSLDTGAFPSAVQLVSSFQAPGEGDRVRVVATLRDRVTDRVKIEGDTLVWSFDKPEAHPVEVAAREVDYDRATAAPYTGPYQAAAAAGATGGGGARFADESDRKKKKKYTGRKINIDIKDADIHNVLRLLAKEGNVNIVTSDTVSGSVTVHLKMVPWDQALDLVLRSKGLDMVQEGNIVRVAKAEDIKAERERELALMQAKDKLKPVNVKLIPVNHAVAGDLLGRINSVLSERGKAEYDTRTNTVIVKDIDENLEAAEDLVRRLDTQTPQVLIEARIVEVNTASDQQFGIQWGGDATWAAATGNPTGLRFPSVVGISGASDDAAGPTEGTASNPNFVVNMPAAIGAGSGAGVGFTFGSVDGTFNLNVRLSAAQSQGQVKIVSSPKIATLDNNMATISQGVSIPISQVSAAGVNTVFFDAVLSLQVKPHVTQDGNIYLELTAENNTPDFQNVGARGDPTILKKNAKTNVLLKDGDTTVIGGIYTSNGGYSQAEVPFFARIPILGVLFRNYRESDRRTELLIFITPRIINRAAASVRTTP